MLLHGPLRAIPELRVTNSTWPHAEGSGALADDGHTHVTINSHGRVAPLAEPQTPPQGALTGPFDWSVSCSELWAHHVDPPSVRHGIPDTFSVPILPRGRSPPLQPANASIPLPRQLYLQPRGWTQAHGVG
jgi:hypothetical protein